MESKIPRGIKDTESRVMSKMEANLLGSKELEKCKFHLAEMSSVAAEVQSLKTELESFNSVYDKLHLDIAQFARKYLPERLPAADIFSMGRILEDATVLKNFQVTALEGKLLMVKVSKIFQKLQVTTEPWQFKLDTTLDGKADASDKYIEKLRNRIVQLECDMKDIIHKTSSLKVTQDVAISKIFYCTDTVVSFRDKMNDALLERDHYKKIAEKVSKQLDYTIKAKLNCEITNQMMKRELADAYKQRDDYKKSLVEVKVSVMDAREKLRKMELYLQAKTETKGCQCAKLNKGKKMLQLHLKEANEQLCKYVVKDEECSIQIAKEIINSILVNITGN